jgi:pimeloyl-ACP methyl ester carboxylesterase
VTVIMVGRDIGMTVAFAFAALYPASASTAVDFKCLHQRFLCKRPVSAGTGIVAS